MSRCECESLSVCLCVAASRDQRRAFASASETRDVRQVESHLKRGGRERRFSKPLNSALTVSTGRKLSKEPKNDDVVVAAVEGKGKVKNIQGESAKI